MLELDIGIHRQRVPDRESVVWAAIFRRYTVGMASISPVRGQGVTLSVLVRSIFQAVLVTARDDWAGSSGRPANGENCWGWYHDEKT